MLSRVAIVIVTGTERKVCKELLSYTLKNRKRSDSSNDVQKGAGVKKRFYIGLLLVLGISCLLSGCGRYSGEQTKVNSHSEEVQKSRTEEETITEEENEKGNKDENTVRITPTSEITELEAGLSTVRYEGDYGFDTFLEQGGAGSDTDVAAYITSLLAQEIYMEGAPFGCSTLSVKNRGGEYLFGRNFDWNACRGLIVSARPENGYASVSTVNMDFIRAGGLDLSELPDQMQAVVSLYAPLDGMNEKGLAVSVNMIQDSASIDQDTEKPDLTTTTAIRLLLDKAANVEEALELLRQYDFHSSMGMMVHLALADADGRSVAVEYVDHEMIVTKTPVVTNFYLASGEKQGIGTAQSHTRYEILTQTLEEHREMTEVEVRNVLDSVSKDNFGEFERIPQGGMRSRGSSETDSECPLETTEWSIVMNQETKELIYYHRENYKTAYVISVE
ncbi:hypothetical protein IMSAGC018_00381 [Lachnospiraceae bacterium]|nr:hypothetical protein IMSAGC018_00381 [Lachnospiraceae bacterium]